MSHFGQVPSVEPVVTHGLSVPSASMELTQLTSINTLHVQLPPPVSTTRGHFINSDVSTCAVLEGNCVSNAADR